MRPMRLGIEAFVSWDLDRLTRQRRQLEDWIDRAEQRSLRLVTTNGEADLQTDGGRMFARIKAVVARSRIERKSAWQKRAQRQRAEMGKAPTNAQGVPIRKGGQWRASSLVSMLKNPRYAGRSTYYVEDVGQATWPVIIDQEKFEAVQGKLSDPRRKTNRGQTARKHRRSGDYLCDCGRTMRARGSARPGYACLDGCYTRGGAQIDAYVLAVIRGRLALPDLRELWARPADRAELKELSDDRAALRGRLKSIEANYGDGVIDGRRYHTATAKGHARLTEVTRKQAALLDLGAGRFGGGMC